MVIPPSPQCTTIYDLHLVEGEDKEDSLVQFMKHLLSAASMPNTLATWCKELTHWNDPDAGKDWRQEEKGTTEEEMVGLHHWLDEHEFEQAPGVGDG